jgi:hypothetical protein
MMSVTTKPEFSQPAIENSCSLFDRFDPIERDRVLKARQDPGAHDRPGPISGQRRSPDEIEHVMALFPLGWRFDAVALDPEGQKRAGRTLCLMQRARDATSSE